MKFSLASDESLNSDDKTAIIILVLFWVHLILLLIYISILIICIKDQKYLKLWAYFWQLHLCTIITLIMWSMAGLFHYLAKKKIIDPSIGVLLIILSILFMIISLLVIIVSVWYTDKTRKTNETCMKILVFDKLDQESEKLFDALTSIIFTENLLLKIIKWKICKNEFRIEDELKVVPEWYHAFHAYCFLKYYISHKSWPINKRYIDPIRIY